MKRIFTFLLALVIVTVSSYSQTVVINTGTAGTPEYNVGPVYMSPTLFYRASRFAYLYTPDELSAVGITNGAIINELGWMKSNTSSSLIAGIFRIYMKNSSATSYNNATETWTNLNAGTTLVYQNLNQLIPATSSPNYITFPLNTPFTYTGGAIEISVEWDATGSSGTLATGSFDWVWSTVVDRIYASGNTTMPTTLSSTTNNVGMNDRRPFIQITYNAGAPCAGIPVGGTTNTAQPSVCPGTIASFSISGASFGTGLTYQWQSSPNGFVWSDIAGATGPSYSQAITTPLSYRRRIICNAGPDTAYSSALSVGVNPFLSCYCASNATAAANASIRNVTFSNINNTSATACDQYTNVTADTAFVNKGLDYPVSVLVEDCEGATFGTQRVGIFIDWNQNGLFTDPGELVYDPGTLPGAATVLFSGSISVPLSALSGVTKMRVINKQATTVINPCEIYTTGETEDYLINVQPQPANEAGVLVITTPEIATCSLGQQLWVNLQNIGTSALTSVNFTVKVNGLNIPVNNPWTGNVPSLGTAEVQVPINYSFADGDSVSVEVSMPNGVAEAPVYAFNNLVARRLYAGLSGNKTVYGVGANFANMDAAIQALNIRGVCDTVYFKIASNTYTTQHTFTEYPNAGPGKLAVFESASGNAADVSYIFPSTAAANNFVFLVDGGDGYMFRNLTAINTGTGFSRVVDIKNGANDITLESNILIGDTAAAYVTGDFTKIVVASVNTTTDNRITLRNNHIIGGNRGVNLGGGTDYETGNIVEGNLIEKYNYIGIILGTLSGYTVKNNTFRPRTNLPDDAYGVYVNGTISGGNILANTVISNRPGSSVYLTNAKGALSKVLVANNFLYQGDTSASTLSRGVTIADVNSSGILVANNSISVSSNNPAGGAITVLDGSEISFFNNNIGSFGDAPVLRIDKSYSMAESDNNNLFGTSISNILGTAYLTLADHQGATNMDLASISVNPGFNGTDLHTCVPELNAAGLSQPTITNDYDGDIRIATPDIGADEFFGDANNLLVENTFLKCPADQVIIGNTAVDGVTYSWSPSGNTSQISTINAGTYVITAISSCGSFSDTAIVTNKPLPTAGFTSSTVGLTGIFNNTSTNATSYLWDFGDGNTSTVQNPSHVYTSAGTYSVSLTVTNECGTSTFGPTSISVVNAGIDENQGMSVSLFPNPTNGLFTVLVSGNGETTTISVIDMTGKTVMIKNMSAGTNQVTLDATGFAAGVYSVKISNGKFMDVIRMVRR